MTTPITTSVDVTDPEYLAISEKVTQLIIGSAMETKDIMKEQGESAAGIESPGSDYRF